MIVSVSDLVEKTSQLGPASLEAWPAAGGGFLVGIAEPTFAGDAPLRYPVKTVFLGISAAGLASLILPYVTLEVEASRCAHALTAGELGLPGEQVIVSANRRSQNPSVIDINPAAEFALHLCAASARTLMVNAAAELWAVPANRCCLLHGIIFGPRRHLVGPCGDFAADAALADLPRILGLRSGRLIRIRSIPKFRRYHRSDVVAIGARHTRLKISPSETVLETETVGR